MMTKKDFKAFARDIYQQYERFAHVPNIDKSVYADIRAIEIDMVIKVAKQNPRFNEAKFRKACGL
jgi:hypothetical protein